MFDKNKVLEEVTKIIDTEIEKNGYIDDSLYPAKKIINFRKMTSKIRELADEIIIKHSKDEEEAEENLSFYERWVYDNARIHVFNNYKFISRSRKNNTDETLYYNRAAGEFKTTDALKAYFSK